MQYCYESQLNDDKEGTIIIAVFKVWYSINPESFENKPSLLKLISIPLILNQINDTAYH